MLAAFPPALSRGGQIVRRQTTFWDVQTVHGSMVRVHFERKVEFEFVAPTFEHAEVTSRHPLLIEYEHPSDDLYVAAPVADPEEVLATLRSITAIHFARWGSLKRYLNDQVSAERVLRGGYGLLLRGPRGFVRDAAIACDRLGMQSTVLQGAAPDRSEQLRALLLGSSFVIAHAFRFS
jgi:hypothetical protein